MKLKQTLKRIFWIIPFINFIIAYHLSSLFLAINQIEVPVVIGKNLNEASKILSDHNLNLRILAQKEDADLPDCTVLDQNPFKQKIKINKPVYLTISRKFKSFKMPNLKGKNLHYIQQILKTNGLKSKIYYIENNADKDTCISHHPEAESLIDKNEKIILYISLNNKKPVLIPNFKGLNLKEVLNFLDLNEIKSTIIINSFQEYEPDKDYKILEQRPIAGSILQLNKNLNIQLQVEEVE